MGKTKEYKIYEKYGKSKRQRKNSLQHLQTLPWERGEEAKTSISR
jgi:hypothetical protein